MQFLLYDWHFIYIVIEDRGFRGIEDMLLFAHTGITLGTAKVMARAAGWRDVVDGTYSRRATAQQPGLYHLCRW